jgi:hypothetical protein
MNIGKHQRIRKMAEKHGETEATEESRNSSKTIPHFLRGEGKLRMLSHGKTDGSDDRPQILTARKAHTS